MIRSEYLGQTTLQAACLPARVVYLVRDGSAKGVRRAVQEACTRWGGMSEPIVPVKPGGKIEDWWQQVVRLTAVDQAVNIDVPQADAEAATAALGLSVVPLGDVDQYGIGAFTMHPGAVGPRAAPGYDAYVIARTDGSLCDAAAAGDLTKEHEASLTTASLSVRRGRDDEVARAQLGEGTTLIERTMDQFGERTTRSGPNPCPAVVWITEPESVEDCLYFWNLRALRPVRFETVPMVLLPVGRIQNWLRFGDRLGYVLARPGRCSPDVAMGSLSVSEDLLHETASLLGLQLSTEEPWSKTDWSAPVRQPPFTYRLDLNVRRPVVFERTHGVDTPVDVHQFTGTTRVRFAAPVRFNGGGQVLIRLWGPPFDKLPQRHVVAGHVMHGASWRQGAIQIPEFARDDYLLELHLPGLPEVVAAVLNDASGGHELSEKGLVAMALAESEAIMALREPGVLEAITQLTTPRSESMLRELLAIRAEGVDDKALEEIATRWGGRSRRRNRAADQLQLGKGVKAVQALERLCAIGWAERGLTLTCQACRVTSFIPLAATANAPACPGCSSPGHYDVRAALNVHYQLSSYVDLASDQGVLPHLLVAAALRNKHPETFLLLGTKVFPNDDKPPEVDIFGVCNGKVIAGEVKTKAADFTDEQITRDTELSHRLGADTHLLAAVDDVPSQVAASAQRACDSLGLELMILQKADLRPGMASTTTHADRSPRS